MDCKLHSITYYFYLVLLIIFIPLVSYSIIGNAITRSRHIREANDILVDMSNTIEQILKLQHDVKEQLLYTLSFQTDIDPLNKGKCEPLLRKFNENFKLVAFLGVANLDGEILCGYPAWDKSINLNNRDYFNKAVENNQFWTGYYNVSQISILPSIGSGYRFAVANNSKDYVLVADQNFVDINNLLIDYPLHNDIDIIFYDASGKFLFGSNKLLTVEPSYSANIMDLEAVRNLDDDFYTTRDNGVKYLVFNKALRENGRISGYLSLRTPTGILYRDIQRELFTQLAILFLLAITSMLIARQIIKKQLIHPLNTTISFSEVLQKGDFKNRLYIQSKSKEIQVLESTINDLVDTLVSELAEKEKGIKRISALNLIDKNITEHKSLEDTFRLVLELKRNLLNVDACVIMEYEDKTKILRCVASTGFLFENENEYFPAVIEDLASPVLLSKEPVLIQRTNENIKQTHWKCLEKEGFEYFYAIPMWTKDLFVGVIGIFQHGITPMNEDTLNFAQTLTSQTAIAIGNARLISEIMDTNNQLGLAYEKTIEGWSKALELRDDETAGHTDRVVRLTIGIAQRMGFDQEQIENLRRGALLHDIGKIGIPDTILLKPGPLNYEERKIMEQHPVYAFEQLQPIEFLHGAIQVPYCHHEKWDGTGYPRGLKGKEIPLEARIFSVVDVWDALLSDRPYRKAWPEAEVIEYMRAQSGKYFDPEILEIFLENIQEFKETYI